MQRAAQKNGQKSRHDNYNIAEMLHDMIQLDVDAAAYGSCIDARGMKDEELVPGARRSSRDEMTAWTIWADKVIAF